MSWCDDVTQLSHDVMKCSNTKRISAFILNLCFVHNRGAHYDVILKFENRQYWGNLLLKYLRVEDDKRFIGMVNVSQRNFMGADVMRVIMKHYNIGTLNVVKRIYKKDIELFNYGDDIKFLENVIRSNVK
jgi:hypothetical protein